MKHRNIVLPLLLALTVTAGAIAQAQTEESNEAADAPSVAAARCFYIRADSSCPGVSSSRDNAPDNGTLVAQYRGRMSGPRMRHRMGYGRPYGRPYGGPWFQEGNPGHAVIGALLLGGLGATLAANTHPNGQRGPNVVGALFVGGLGAVFGAIIGNSIPEHHSYRHRTPWPDDDDEYASVTHQRRGSEPSPDGGVRGSTVSRTTSSARHSNLPSFFECGNPFPSPRISLKDPFRGWLPRVTFPVQSSLIG